MSDEEALAQAKEDFNVLSKRVRWSQNNLEHYSHSRDDVVSKVHVLLGGSYQATAAFLDISSARVYQILKRWKENNGSADAQDGD
jgi:hypothetical protein